MADKAAAHDHDEDFQTGDAGASATLVSHLRFMFSLSSYDSLVFHSISYPQQCSALRKNGYVMLKDRPCKIMEMSTSKTGKHGHAKVDTSY